jgi:hypothetical protein
MMLFMRRDFEGRVRLRGESYRVELSHLAPPQRVVELRVSTAMIKHTQSQHVTTQNQSSNV